jgi:hypothetical protein
MTARSANRPKSGGRQIRDKDLTTYLTWRKHVRDAPGLETLQPGEQPALDKLGPFLDSSRKENAALRP